jgi:glutaredoxin
MAQLKIYGADWCEHTQRLLSHLDGLGVKYTYINIEEDEHAAAWVRHQNDGKESKPTVDVGGIILLTPSEFALDDALRDAQLLPAAADQ